MAPVGYALASGFVATGAAELLGVVTRIALPDAGIALVIAQIFAFCLLSVMAGYHSNRISSSLGREWSDLLNRRGR